MYFKPWQILHCDKEHIAHNKVLAQSLDVLSHLVNYGYYDSMSDIEEILEPIMSMLESEHYEYH